MTNSEYNFGECLAATALSAFVMGEMSEDERAGVQDHLQWCSLCQEEVELVQQFINQDIIEDLSQSYQSEELKKIEGTDLLFDRLFGHLSSDHKSAVSKKIEEYRVEIERLLKSAEQVSHFSRNSEAKTYVEEALTIARKIYNKKYETQALGRLGSIHWETGNTTEALRYYEQSLEIAQAINYQQGKGVALGGLGKIFGSHGKHREAITYIEQAIAIERENGGRQLICRLLNNLAVSYLGLGNSTEAISCYTQALVIAQEVGDQWCETRVIGGLGNCYKNLGDLSRAGSYYEQGLEIAQKVGDRQGEGKWLNNLGTIYKRLGKLSQATSFYEDALAIAVEVSDKDGEATRLRNLGTLCAQQGNYPIAIKYLERSLVIAQKRGKHQEGEAFKSLGNVYLRQGDFIKAIACYETALRIAKETEEKKLEGYVLGNLGTAYAGIDEFTQAIDCLSSGIAILHTLGIVDDERELWADLGSVYLQVENFTEAYKAFLTSIEQLDDIRGSISLLQDQSGVLERGLPAYQGLVETCFRLNRDAEALEYVERAKSDRLLQLLATRDLRFKGQIPPLIVHEYEDCRHKLRSLSHAFRMGQSVRPEHPLTRQTETEFEEAKKRFDQVVMTIKTFDPDFVATTQMESLTHHSIQETVPDEQTAIVEFFMTRDKVLMFVVLKSEGLLPLVILPTLTPSQVRKLASDWLQTYVAFRTNPTAEWKRWGEVMDSTLALLYAQLFMPLKPLLDSRTITKLVFIPSQELHLFPLHALYSEENGQRHYLIDLYDEISYAPSATIFRRCQNLYRHSQKKILLISNPDHKGKYGRPLKYAEQEAALITERYPGACIRKEKEADFDSILQEARESDILHLICHSFFDFNHPLQSYLGLFHQRVTLGEIFEKLELPQVSLVVLSACETGVVEISRVDEYIGLPSGFITAGAPTIISSLWMVNDEATSGLMSKLYENLQAGMSKTRALNEAQRWIKSTLTEKSLPASLNTSQRFSLLSKPFPIDYSHPFYWAAFYLSGAS